MATAQPIPYKLIGAIALWLVVTYWTARLLQQPTDQPFPWIFLDNMNLLIHEAGHWLFLPFGQFMNILGGSLLQCLFPAIIAGYFIWKQDWIGTAFSIFWTGDNLNNVSYYIADAQAMALPLLGGDASGHDWHNLLSMLGWLNATEPLATAIRIMAILCFFAAQILLFTAILLIWQNGNHFAAEP
jgi:hypothetical protein